MTSIVRGALEKGIHSRSLKKSKMDSEWKEVLFWLQRDYIQSPYLIADKPFAGGHRVVSKYQCNEN